jgi:RimJ/RimL family protein N-acetyltransferase
MIKFIETDRLILSPPSSEDIKGNYRYWINSQNTDEWTQHAVFPKSDLALLEYYKTKNDANNSIWLGIFLKTSGVHIGNIDVSGINWINRTGIYNILIGELTEQGKGYGFESSVALLRHVFNRLNLNRIQLGVELGNRSAIALYKKLGFQEEGVLRQNICKNGDWLDSLIMGLLRDEFIYK